MNVGSRKSAYVCMMVITFPPNDKMCNTLVRIPETLVSNVCFKTKNCLVVCHVTTPRWNGINCAPPKIVQYIQVKSSQVNINLKLNKFIQL